MKNIYFIFIVAFILALHLLTYPSVHHISDEYTFMNVSKKFCNLDFSDIFGKVEEPTHNTPLLYVVLCATSPLHNFNVETAELVTFSFLILMVIGWYFSMPNEMFKEKRKFVILLLANALLWVYSLRVLLDLPLAMLLSLGMLNLFLFYEKGGKKNYYIALAMLSLALFTKETAFLYFPIFLIYLLLKRFPIKKIVFLIPPIIPFLTYLIVQYLSGFPVQELYSIFYKATTNVNYVSLIPYDQLPIFAFLIGIFGVGVITFLLAWKDVLLRKNTYDKFLNDFILFSLVLYIFWEIFYDSLTFANMPRYSTTLMPFLTLIISESTLKKSRLFKYLFYITLIYTLVIGFLVAYYFHVQTLEIWKVPIKDFISSLLRKWTWW